MKVIIAGGRDYNDVEKLYTFCNKVLQNQTNIEIISGCAKGADSIGELYARDKGYPIIKFPANWREFGKQAGMIRNIHMAENADILIAFWNGYSSGTKHMINIAYKYNLKTFICKY